MVSLPYEDPVTQARRVRVRSIKQPEAKVLIARACEDSLFVPQNLSPPVGTSATISLKAVDPVSSTQCLEKLESMSYGSQ